MSAMGKMCERAMRLVQITWETMSLPGGTTSRAWTRMIAPTSARATPNGANHQRTGAESGDLACSGPPTAAGIVCPPIAVAGFLRHLVYVRCHRGPHGSGEAVAGQAPARVIGKASA